MKSVWVAAICCSLLVSVAGFSQGRQDPVIDEKHCGFMGQTPIEECKEVADSEKCPLGLCVIGGGGGKKRCGRWISCSPTSCIREHGQASVCVKVSRSSCNAYCLEQSNVDYTNRKYPGTYTIQD